MQSELKVNGFSEVAKIQQNDVSGGFVPALVGATIVWAANAGLLSYGLCYYHDHVSSGNRRR